MKTKTDAIRAEYWVEKRNLLNESGCCAGFSLQELRLLAVYLAKINARNPETKKVTFLLEDFRRILGLGRIGKPYFLAVIDGLYSKKIHVPRRGGGFEAIYAFRQFSLERDATTGTQYVKMEAHDDALPYFFSFKGNYFKYQLWNALSLRSANQFLLYELLKQYELAGERTIALADLRGLIGVAPGEYKKFNDFKRHVLETGRIALTNCTDITFSYIASKRGRAGKVKELRFFIEKNRDYRTPAALQNRLPPEETDEAERLEIPEQDRGDERYEAEIQHVYTLCERRFAYPQVKYLRRLLRLYFHNALYCAENPRKTLQLHHFDYLEERYAALLQHHRRSLIGYLIFALDLDLLHRYGIETLEGLGHQPCRKALEAYRRDVEESL